MEPSSIAYSNSYLEDYKSRLSPLFQKDEKTLSHLHELLKDKEFFEVFDRVRSKLNNRFYVRGQSPKHIDLFAKNTTTAFIDRIVRNDKTVSATIVYNNCLNDDEQKASIIFEVLNANHLQSRDELDAKVKRGKINPSDFARNIEEREWCVLMQSVEIERRLGLQTLSSMLVEDDHDRVMQYQKKAGHTDIYLNQWNDSRVVSKLRSLPSQPDQLEHAVSNSSQPSIEQLMVGGTLAGIAAIAFYKLFSYFNGNE